MKGKVSEMVVRTAVMFGLVLNIVAVGGCQLGSSVLVKNEHLYYKALMLL